MNYLLRSTHNNHNTYIPGIDGLRALAVISVIFFHLKASLLPGGFSGVDVFFVISGYVVSSSLSKEDTSSFWRFAVNFYSRRIVRIYPALLACLLIITLFQTFLVPSSWLSLSVNKTGLAAFFGMSNFALIWFSDGYFSPRVEFNMFTHTWSLAVEEQFYFLFPAVFFVWLKGRHRKDSVGTIANWLLPSLLAISFIIAYIQTSASPDHAYFLLPSRFWELACGAVLFKLHAQNKCITESKILIESTIAIGLILICLGFAFSDSRAFPFPWALLPVVGTILAISGVVSNTRTTSYLGNLLSNRPVVYIGKISYSLYLWHWPIIVIFRWTIGIDKPIYMLIAALLTIVAAALSYRFIEVPIRKSKVVISMPNHTIVSRGVTTIIACTLIAAGIFYAQPVISLSVTKDKNNWHALPEQKIALFETENRLYQGRRLYVMGDSHTGAYSKMLSMLENRYGVSVKQFSKAGCAVANLLTQATPECATFIQESIAKIKAEAKPGDIVFLASLRMNRLGDQWATFDEAEIEKKQLGPAAAKNREVALEEANHIIASLESTQLSVLIDAPKPIFKSPPFRCADWFNARNSICQGGTQLSRDLLLQHREPVMASLNVLQKNHPNLIIWDPFPILCPSDVCSAFDNNNLPIFFDGDHLSGHGNRMLYPSFASLIASIWRGH